MIDFRLLLPSDQTRLWEWLHLALWDPPPAPLRPREVLEHPHVRIYAEEWGRRGDLGLVAQLEGKDIGACWMRLLPERIGLAWVDEATPQMGIALEPAYQNKGYGKQLLLATMKMAKQEAGYRQISLTVHPENPAIRLYRQCGFVQREVRSTYLLMVARIDEE